MSKPLDPELLDLAFRTAAFRKDFDALLAKHGGDLLLGWEGKWCYLQVQFREASTDKAATFVKVDRSGRRRYFTEAEEIAAELRKSK